MGHEHRRFLAASLLCALPLLAPSAAAANPTGATSPSPLTAVWAHLASGWGEPAIDGGRAYFLTRSHELVALDSSTGHLRWRVATGGRGEVTWGAVIRAVGDRVVTGDGDVFACDASSGARRWRFAPRRDVVAPFLGDAAGDVVYVGSARGRLFAVALDSGRPRWSKRLGRAKWTTVFAPAAAGSGVVASFRTRGATPGGGVAAFAANGRLLWRRALPKGIAVSGPPVVIGEFVAVAGSDGSIVVLTAAGREVWRHRPDRPGTTDGAAEDIRALAGARAVLVAGSLDGSVTAFDVANGQRRWSYVRPGGAATLRLRADDGTVYAPFTDDTLVALDAATGDVRWQIGGVAQPVEWPPAVGAGRVFVAGVHALVAYPLPDGSVMPDAGK